MERVNLEVARDSGPSRAQAFRRAESAGGAGRPGRFDLAFGIFLPILCFAFDPVIFRGWLFRGGGVYQQYQFYAYSVGAIEIVALGAWLFPTAGVRRRPAVLAGMLLAGGVFSLAVGALILPFTLLGLIFVVGVLGFIPFVTGFVYLRNGLRAAALSRSEGVLRAGAVASLAFGFVFALGAPAAAQLSITRGFAAALADVSGGKELSPSRLRAVRLAAAVVGPSACDRIVWAYMEEGDPARRARLVKAYAEITGEGIERRLAVLSD